MMGNGVWAYPPVPKVPKVQKSRSNMVVREVPGASNAAHTGSCVVLRGTGHGADLKEIGFELPEFVVFGVGLAIDDMAAASLGCCLPVGEAAGGASGRALTLGPLSLYAGEGEQDGRSGQHSHGAGRGVGAGSSRMSTGRRVGGGGFPGLNPVRWRRQPAPTARASPGCRDVRSSWSACPDTDCGIIGSPACSMSDT